LAGGGRIAGQLGTGDACWFPIRTAATDMIGRRKFLQWSTATPLLLAQSLAAGAASRAPQNTIVVIDDILPSTDADRIAVVLATFARKGLPVSCLIDTQASGKGWFKPESALCRVLRDQWQALPGLIEIVPFVTGLGEMTPYFQARAAYEARSSLRDSLWGDSEVRLERPKSQTIACDVLNEPTAPSGVRASGIRNVLMRPSASMPVRPEAWNDGVVRMIGGQRIQLRAPPNAIHISGLKPVERVLYLSAADFAAEPLAALGESATVFASRVLRQDGSHWASALLASDIQYRDDYQYQRNLGLHFMVSADATAEDHEILSNFRLELIRADMPSSFGGDTNGNPDSGYWVPVEGVRTADLPIRPLDIFATTGDEIMLVEKPTPGTPFGIGTKLADLNNVGVDSDNILRLPTVIIHETEDLPLLSTSIVGNADCAIAISDKVLRSKPQRSALKKALEEISNDGISNVTTLSGYARRIVPSGPYITHFRRTQSYQQRAFPEPKVQDSDKLERLMEDAKVAWSYFQRWTNTKTGLCPATVNFSIEGRTLHEAVTMWDVGSHINALIAAVDLQLISPEKFDSSIKSILPNIAGRRSQKRLLPQGWIATDKFRWGNRNFDGCDAGRLLAALYNLEIHPLFNHSAAAIVKAWDLDKIVRDGVVYSVENGKLSSTFGSHCAHYAAWAFRIWGIEARSPYEVLQGKSISDGQMALLEVCGQIGPMGAEPLLMEAIELGMSPESTYLADVLFAAQLEEYEQSGKLICVSEGPIDSPPWFLYQGLQFDAPGRVWATDTVEGLSEHRTKTFRDKHLAISSKGAYLWAAYKNHPYCDALVTIVREKATSSNGFASSINLHTGRASGTYTDINTNAVILQSIAQIIRDAQENG